MPATVRQNCHFFMKFRKVLIIAVFLTFTNILLAENNSLVQEAKKSLDNGVSFFHEKVATEGGYLWTYSADLTERAGEGEATETQIWVQPPGTPSVGEAYLRAYKATDDQKCLDAAEHAAKALIWGQLASGGWDYKIDFDPKASKRWYFRRDLIDGKPAEGRNTTTFDDNTTQSALRFLMAIDQVTDKPEYRSAVEFGLDSMLKSQFENGAWPQRYPLAKKGYSRLYTFNDDAINDCINVMLEAYRIYGDERYIESVKRAGDFIILSQLPKPQAGWAQQYSYEMKPAWARSFEPPAVCSAVTSDNIRTLLELYVVTGEEKYLEPMPAAIEWLEKSKIGENLWARFYELESNRPIYCDRGRKIFYDIAQLGDERRHGYSWQSSYGIQTSISRYKKIKKIERQEFLAQRARELTRDQKVAQFKKLESRISDIISGQDEQGRWIANGQIRTKDFVRNLKYLSQYLKLAKDLDLLKIF